MRRVAWLAFWVLFVWLIAGVPADLLLGGAPMAVSLLAGTVCLIPAALTLWVIDRMRTRAPEEKAVAALGAPFVRMTLSGGGGAWVYFDVPVAHAHGAAFIAWMVVFYLLTLAVETRLLYIVTSGQAAAEPSNR